MRQSTVFQLFLLILVIAKPCNGCGNPSSFKKITDSFALCAQNDKPFSHCEHRKVRGNPFSFKEITDYRSRFYL